MAPYTLKWGILATGGIAQSEYHQEFDPVLFFFSSFFFGQNRG
jgi:hypothetical protein